MSNEIKYVNEAGVRRIITDTRARLTDLTTDMDSAFGFSLDLSDIDTTLQTGIEKTITFNLPKEFSADEYDIFAKVHLSFNAALKHATPPYYIGDIPVTDGAPDVKNCEFLVPITGVTYYKSRTQMKTYYASQRYIETISGQTTSYECHCKSANAQETISTSIRFRVSEGLYSLDFNTQDTTCGLLTHIYGSTNSSSSYAISGTHYVEYTANPAIGNITFSKRITAIEILIRKKLEATAE